MNKFNSYNVKLLLNRFPNDVISMIRQHYCALIIQSYFRKNRYKFNRNKRFRKGDRVLFRLENKFKYGTINSCINIQNNYIYNIESLEYINKRTHKHLSNNYISLYKNTSIYTTKLYKIVENCIYKLVKWKYYNKLSQNYNFYHCDRIKHYFKTKFINQKINNNSYLLNSLTYLTEKEQIDFFYSFY